MITHHYRHGNIGEPGNVDVLSDDGLETYGFGYTATAWEISQAQLAALQEGATLAFGTDEGGTVFVRLQR